MFLFLLLSFSVFFAFCVVYLYKEKQAPFLRNLLPRRVPPKIVASQEGGGRGDTTNEGSSSWVPPEQ